MLILLLAAMILSCFIGSVNISLSRLLSPELRSILFLRFSRAALAGIAGASLAVVGAILQGLLRNPLADPYVLGISSGAGLGAVAAIVLGLSSFFGFISVPLFAFLGGIATIFFVYFLSRKASRIGTEDLVLSGVITAAMLSGIIMYFVSSTEKEGLHSAMWWLLGNTQIFDIRLLIAVASVSLIGIILSILLARNLNIMSLGEQEAITTGLNTERIKFIFFIISSVMTAAVVSVCGMIGFVGLIIPHMSRRVVGPEHSRVIPHAALLGAAFLILCDILARRITAPVELPIGVVTAVIGAPFFIFLLKRSRRPEYR
jgi:iron complex transport system permease protein